MTTMGKQESEDTCRLLITSELLTKPDVELSSRGFGGGGDVKLLPVLEDERDRVDEPRRTSRTPSEVRG